MASTWRGRWWALRAPAHGRFRHAEPDLSPPYRVLTALAFDDPYLAADVVPRVLEFGPIGLEGFDGLLVDFMLRKNLASTM
jgi:hypothetical protein